MTDYRIALAFTLAVATVLCAGPLPAHGQSLYADPVATSPGDVITVVLAEQTSAQRASSYEGSSESSVSGGGSAAGPGLSSQFGADAQFNSETGTSNQSVQSGTLEGTMTVRVVEVNEAGNLVVEGTRNLTVNGATHVMEISGIVRSDDVRHDNTILSHQIANANIKYNQSGFRHNGLFSKGLLLKAGSAVALGVGIFLGLK